MARCEALSLPGPALKAPWKTVFIVTANARTPIIIVAPKVGGFQLKPLNV